MIQFISDKKEDAIKRKTVGKIHDITGNNEEEERVPGVTPIIWPKKNEETKVE